MDTNGLRFWMLADAGDWQIGNASRLRYDQARRSLRLASERAIADATGSEANAKSLLERAPQTRDAFGTRAYWDSKSEKVMATGALDDAVPIYIPPAETWPTDLAMGYDGALYVALAVTGEVVMQDRRGRWDNVTLSSENFIAWRLAANPRGGVWALDRTNRKLGKIKGQPLPPRPYGLYSPAAFRPCEENSDPPRLIIFPGAVCPDDETPVAIASSPQGRVALLTWIRKGESHEEGFARIRCLKRNERFDAHTDLIGASFPYSFAWVSETRVALMLENLKSEAPVYEIAEQEREEKHSTRRVEEPKEILPVGDLYPLRDRDDTSSPFVNSVTLPPHYPTASGTAALRRLSLPSFAKAGEAANNISLDSGSGQTIWHRLYIEAAIPPNCGVKVFLAASDDLAPPVDDAEWHEHRFGEIFANDGESNLPRGAWVSTASEIPFHAGLLDCEREKNRAGLFTALIQRSNRRVRALRGRYIHARVALSSDGRATPEIAALRVYASRFSYLNRYLPELYHETLFADDADEIITSDERSTQPDFLGRFLDNFEGVLTPLEDRIANAYLLTDARATPDDALEWLGSWIGMSFDPAYPKHRRRELLRSAPKLYRLRGTLDGLKLALDIVTGGAVSGGEIVVLEDFRLRRAFATILGADFADEDDPLLAGFVDSGNSFVGDTLFLGDENKKEFLALFGPDIETSAEEQKAIAALFDRLAHRVTALVHQEVEPQNLGLIRRVVELETPAHVLARVVTASYPFLVGMASLIGVDTYLAARPQPRPVTVEVSRVGRRDFILRPPSLDPRLESGNYDSQIDTLRRPVADAGPDQEVEFGASFTLDGSRSKASEGRKITEYKWKMRE